MLNRRNFIKTAAAGAAFGMLNPMDAWAAQAAPVNAVKHKSPFPPLQFDVIVVGAGGSQVVDAI
ncbi:MAG: twin-arginine translocation signal domain-containing protein, partial [Candidatus Symbiothrix sp.]|nr:twin-arginine translocation signal domain-containing protein [Candidatus Symbiothrix sp.]